MPKPPLPDKLGDLLAKPNPAVIATVRPDGQPVSVATWYLWEAGRILVNMDGTRKRLTYLRHDPRVSLTVFPAHDWYEHVSLQGTVAELRDDPDLVDIDRLAQHYLGQPYPDRNRHSISALIDIDYWHNWNPTG